MAGSIRLQLCVVVAAGFCLATPVTAQTCKDDTQTIEIADPALLRAVLTTLRKPSSSRPTCGDVKTLKQLDAHGHMIRSLVGLDYFVELTSLDLRENALRDVAPLARLTKLVDLHLEANFVDNLAPLLSNVGAAVSRPSVSVYLRGNCLDISDGSDDTRDRDALIAFGVTVSTGQQRPAAECTRR